MEDQAPEQTKKATLLPDRLVMATSDEYFDLLLESTERLYFWSSTEFVGELAGELNFPRWMEDERCGMYQVLDHYDITINGKVENLPMVASFTFYRRPLDGKICAIANSTGMLTHYQLFREKVLDLMPKVKADRRMNIVEPPMVQMDYRRWLLEGQELESALGRPIIKLRAAMLRNLEKDEAKLDAPYVAIPGVDDNGKSSYTRRELATELRGNTKKAADLMVQLMNLTADKLLRESEKK